MTKLAQMAERKLSPDDWGFSPAINEAMLALAERGWVHTVSVLPEAPCVAQGVERLRAMQQEGKIQVALHFTAPLARLWHFSSARSALKKQAERLGSLGLRMDSINGHRHVHLHPFFLRAAREIFPHHPLRVMRDPAHFSSWAASSLAHMWIPGVNRQRCGYLLREDLASPESLARKLSAFEQVICHPAMRDDFASAGMTDRLRGERVEEYRLLREFLP